MGDELLGWLLPEAHAEEQAAMRRVITALRLLHDDARQARARRAAPSWPRARRELESLERRARRRAIDALLHAHLSALRSADSFLDLGPRALEYDAAWRALLFSPEAARTGFPPAPAEPVRTVIERLLAAGVASGASPHWRQWWSACARHAFGPPTRAEPHWEALLRSAGSGARAAFRARLAAGLVAARLERFQPARAWALHERHAELVASDASLRRLLGWTALLCGEEASARRLLSGAPAATLPRPLAELREDWPAWGALLPGPSAPPALVPELERSLDRGAFGALLLGVFARRPSGRTEVLALDAPEDLCAEVEQHAARSFAPEVLLEGANLSRERRGERRHARRDDGHADAFGGSRSRALYLAAVRDPGGELAGWIQLESTHQLLPSAAILQGLARAWSAPVLATRRTAAASCTSSEFVLPMLALPSRDPFANDDPRSEFARRLFGALGPLGGKRAYWFELDRRGGACVRAEHGGGLGDWTERPGGGRIAARARAERTPVSHRGEPADSIHAAAAAGFALPLLAARSAEVLGVLVLESARAALSVDALCERARAALGPLEPAWWATSFRAACLARDGKDVAWELDGRFLRSLAPALEVAAEARTPLLLVGPPGSGRRTLARWLHFRGPSAALELVEGVGSPGAGGRLLELSDLSRQAQLELARAAGGRERLFLLAAAPAHRLRAHGELAPELERVLDPLPLCVPPLCERRDEIPGLVRAFAAGVARAEALRAPRFDEQAIGALWRQDWRGNVSELSAFVAQLVRSCAGRELGSAEVRAAFRSRGLEYRARLPSARPRALDLELALATTRHQVGSENLARAARYLGWDPDTLRARLSERRASARE